MKYCMDCVYCKLLIGFVDGADYSRCLHPAFAPNPSVSLVTGEINPILSPYASAMRRRESCGEEAMLFEPMPTPDLPTGTAPGFYHGRATEGVVK